MQILVQNREAMVNLNLVHSVTFFDIGETKNGKNYRMLAWTGNGIDDCVMIGDYQTEERCKEIIRDIWKTTGEYLHRPYSQAILRGSVDIPEMFVVLPKIYEMPEE